MNKIYEEGYIQDIADAIRTKNGSQNTYKVSQMATAIENLPSSSSNNELIVGNLTSLNGLANTKQDLIEINNLDCSYLQNQDLSAGLNNFQYITKISLLNTSNITNMMNCFSSCPLVETIEIGTPSSCLSYNNAFSNCTSLVDIIGLDLSNVTQENGIYGMVYGCPSLSDDTLNDIMSEVASMQNYTGNKYFRTILGIDSSITDARLQSLSAYPDLISAGWTL